MKKVVSLGRGKGPGLDGKQGEEGEPGEGQDGRENARLARVATPQHAKPPGEALPQLQLDACTANAPTGGTGTGTAPHRKATQRYTSHP
jgi:hypothetical protein